MKVVAVLETMWDWRNRTSDAGYRHEAPHHFQINANNFSGRRLYKLVGGAELIVTNACRELVSSATEHGVPDPGWLGENLRSLWPFDVLLLCGKVAQKTFKGSAFDLIGARIIEMPHPAARAYWTTATIAATQERIRGETTSVGKPSRSDTASSNPKSVEALSPTGVEEEKSL